MTNFTISQTPSQTNMYVFPWSDNTAVLSIFPASPTTHWDKVDDCLFTGDASKLGLDDADSTYVYNDSATEKIDIFNCTDYTTETGTINYVEAVAIARSHLIPQSPSGIYKIKVASTGTFTSNNFAPLTTAYNKYSQAWATRPAGGAWTWADINAMSLHIDCSSPLVTGNTDVLTLLPDSAGTINQFNRYIGYTLQGAGDATNYTYVNTSTFDSMLKNDSISPAQDSWGLADTSQTGTVNSVTLWLFGRKNTTSARTFKFGLRIGGVYYYSPDITLTTSENELWYSYTWALNPATSAAWTFAIINGMEIGVSVSATYALEIYGSCYAAVNYTMPSISPQIRTTALYAKVNYNPAASVVTMLCPEETSLTNTRRNERFIFPDGTYALADYGRQSKTLTMRGTDVTTAITDMRAIRTMQNSDSPVTIAGLSDVNQDIQWRIRDFNYEYESGGDHFKWDMELISYD